MMDATDRHCRYFMRTMSARTLLYTEMITAVAIVNGDRDALLGHHDRERPLALQIGGSEPRDMAAAARAAADFGYDEVNVNVGCPSDRVRSGRFGACLMAEPDRVAECVASMRAAAALPVTVKCRIGIDSRDRYEDLRQFVRTVHAAGCDTFIVHARKAWLKGLSPKQNREVPPLRYPDVYRLRAEHPRLEVVINGGIDDLDSAETHLQHVDGVMLGRAAYRNPWLLRDVDARLFGDAPLVSDREAVVDAMLPYIEAQVRAGTPLARITRHMSGLYLGQPGARRWRREMSERARRSGAGADAVRSALAFVARRDVREAACTTTA